MHVTLINKCVEPLGRAHISSLSFQNDQQKLCLAKYPIPKDIFKGLDDTERDY